MTHSANDLVVDGYDAVYAALPRSPRLRSIWRQHALGPDYPDGFEPISFLTFPELSRMAEALSVRRGDTLVDLGCGAGGPALWMAQRTGARLIGVDASAIGVEQAAVRARAIGLAGPRFVVGRFDETRLTPTSAAAVMSVDALQYAPNKRAAFIETARILAAGGRFVFTAFELEPARVSGLPVLGIDPVSDYRPLLEEARFSIDVYEETPGWRERLTNTYQAVVDALPVLTDEMGQRAVAALGLEVSMTLQHQPYKRRVFVACTKQGGDQ